MQGWRHIHTHNTTQPCVYFYPVTTRHWHLNLLTGVCGHSYERLILVFGHLACHVTWIFYKTIFLYKIGSPTLLVTGFISTGDSNRAHASFSMIQSLLQLNWVTIAHPTKCESQTFHGICCGRLFPLVVLSFCCWGDSHAWRSPCSSCPPTNQNIFQTKIPLPPNDHFCIGTNKIILHLFLFIFFSNYISFIFITWWCNYYYITPSFKSKSDTIKSFINDRRIPKYR